MAWWNKESKPEDDLDPNEVNFVYGKPGTIIPCDNPEKMAEKIETLQTTNIPIKGNEPFLTFSNARIIVNFTDYSRRSHNFEWPATDFEKPWSVLQPGDTLRIQFSKVTQVEFPWYKRLLLKLVEKL